MVVSSFRVRLSWGSSCRIKEDAEMPEKFSLCEENKMPNVISADRVSEYLNRITEQF